MREKRQRWSKGSEEMGVGQRDWFQKNQRNLFAPHTHRAPEIAEVGMLIERKELEGVIANRVYFLCEVRAKVTCSQQSVGIWGHNLKRER